MKRALVSVTQDVELSQLSLLSGPQFIPLEKEGEKLSRELCIFMGFLSSSETHFGDLFGEGRRRGAGKALWLFECGVERDLLLWVMPLLTHLAKVMQDVHAARLSHWTFFGIVSLQIMKWRHY